MVTNRNHLTVRSILNLINTLKVTKAPSKRQSLCKKIKVLYNALRPADKATTDLGTPGSRNNKASIAKDNIPGFLRSVHSSKISKPSKEQLIRQHENGLQLLKKENGLTTSSTLFSGRKPMQQFVNALLRKISQISKQPKRFRLGQTWAPVIAFLKRSLAPYCIFLFCFEAF